MLNRYYIGLNDKDKHKQILSNETMELLVSKIVSKQVENFTIIKAKGFYKGEPENTLIVEIIGDTLNAKTLEELKTILNQECILYTAQQIATVKAV